MSEFKKDKKYLTQKEVADVLNIKVATLNYWRYCGRHSIPEIRMGRKILFPKDKFFQWLENTYGKNLEVQDDQVSR